MRLLRGGEGGGSARCVRHQLDVTQKIFPRIELVGSSVAVWAGVQLRVSVASSMSHFFFRENGARRLLRGGVGGGSAWCVRFELDVVKLYSMEGLKAVK